MTTNKPIDSYTLQHLARFMINHIREDHHIAFKAFALSHLEEDPDYWMNLGWSSLYGKFLMK